MEFRHVISYLLWYVCVGGCGSLQYVGGCSLLYMHVGRYSLEIIPPADGSFLSSLGGRAYIISRHFYVIFLCVHTVTMTKYRITDCGLTADYQGLCLDQRRPRKTSFLASG